MCSFIVSKRLNESRVTYCTYLCGCTCCRIACGMTESCYKLCLTYCTYLSSGTCCRIACGMTESCYKLCLTYCTYLSGGTGCRIACGMTESCKLFISCIVATRTCYVLVPTLLGTGRSLCRVCDFIVAKSLNESCTTYCTYLCGCTCCRSACGMTESCYKLCFTYCTYLRCSTCCCSTCSMTKSCKSLVRAVITSCTIYVILPTIGRTRGSLSCVKNLVMTESRLFGIGVMIAA